ncbi:MAG: hypothetical protein U5L96_20375 [Owenweeksia sp.]|nr:hypothetical protein [Owenweeksia sp.]
MEKLMQVRDGEDSLVNIEKNQVKITAINLVNEARQSRKFVAQKNLKN